MAQATFTIEFTNQKAVRKLREAIDAVIDASTDQPWNMELKQAAKNLKYVAKHIGVRTERK